MDDIEKALVTLMKVTNRLMRRTMIVVSRKTKITKKLKKLGNSDVLKVLDESEGPNWREYISLIGEYGDLLRKAK